MESGESFKFVGEVVQSNRYFKIQVQGETISGKENKQTKKDKNKRKLKTQNKRTKTM